MNTLLAAYDSLAVGRVRRRATSTSAPSGPAPHVVVLGLDITQRLLDSFDCLAQVSGGRARPVKPEPSREELVTAYGEVFVLETEQAMQFMLPATDQYLLPA